MDIENDQELIVVVDKENNIIGSGLRSEMRILKQIHRSAFVFLVDSRSGKIFIQKRKITKRWCGGYWDVFFGGVVQASETYEETARRELQEETGVQTKVEDIQNLFDFYFENERTKAWGRCFLVFYDGKLEDLKPCPLEIELVQLVEFSKIEEMKQQGELFTPDGDIGLQRFIDQGFYDKLVKPLIQ